MTVLAAGIVSCAPDREFTVDTTLDLHDLDPGDGICAADAVGTECSLRAAFEETNGSIATQRVLITVPAGVYDLTLTPGLELSRGLVTVSGAGQAQTIVDGLDGRRILTIKGGDARQIVFENLRLRNGSSGATLSGGAVSIDSPNYLVTFTSVTIENSMGGFRGGGIYAQGTGTLNVLNSRIEGNSSAGETDACDAGGGASGGGGVFAQDAIVNVVQSEVRDNCGSNGAGIRLLRGANHLILRSTVSHNRGPNTGAGILFENTDARIEDSTIAHNRITASDAITEGSAGGIHVIDSDLKILSSTIAENENPFEGAEGAGGLVVHESSVSIRNTVLAENDFFGIRECFGSIESDGGNFVGETNDDCDISDQPSDILDGGNPEVGPLQLNGGLTRTMLPLSTSPLVDAGVSGCEEIDQRGLDFQAPRGAACDIGAVER